MIGLWNSLALLVPVPILDAEVLLLTPERGPAAQAKARVKNEYVDPEVECAIQLRRIGDKLNFRQKLVNLIAKLLRSGT
ncbi:hypothetical protein MJG53_015750 [Ovis ammon polii x Ovis aries]|uniref:Uncharacterized protein n=1 Tax=Ovis ammon polii x Ovis aries TaxID=2918886 RepID=A0ACB9UBT7_9CETA|nr:hypothetical protein MJG53_015750 [Ovis ammon polii x Ovis aries]